VIDELGVVDGQDRRIVVRGRGVTSAPADVSASRSTTARSGTSVPASHTPSQTSPSGSCSRQSLCHTTGRPGTPAASCAVIDP